jgi:starvation-inducible DNA-binding protein
MPFMMSVQKTIQQTIVSAGARGKVRAILNHVLTDELRLSTATRQFYASVTGPNFHSLHRLFADQYRELDQWLEKVAERSRAVGASAAKQKKVAAASSARAPRPELPAREMVDDLLTQHERLAAQLRDDAQTCSGALGDTGTAEILRRMVDFHETAAWILRVARRGTMLAPS